MPRAHQGLGEEGGGGGGRGVRERARGGEREGKGDERERVSCEGILSYGHDEKWH